MKKVIGVICCLAGGMMIGLFAGQLNSIPGALCFTGGVALLVGGITLAGKGY